MIRINDFTLNYKAQEMMQIVGRTNLGQHLENWINAKWWTLHNLEHCTYKTHQKLLEVVNWLYEQSQTNHNKQASTQLVTNWGVVEIELNKTFQNEIYFYNAQFNKFIVLNTKSFNLMNTIEIKELLINCVYVLI